MHQGNSSQKHKLKPGLRDTGVTPGCQSEGHNTAKDRGRGRCPCTQSKYKEVRNLKTATASLLRRWPGVLYHKMRWESSTTFLRLYFRCLGPSPTWAAKHSVSLGSLRHPEGIPGHPGKVLPARFHLLSSAATPSSYLSPGAPRGRALVLAVTGATAQHTLEELQEEEEVGSREGPVEGALRTPSLTGRPATSSGACPRQ